MGFSQPLNQESSNNGEEGKMGGKTGLSFLLATICLAKFWPKLLDEATLLAIIHRAANNGQWQSPGWVREQAFAFQRRERPS